ncbi:DAR GTPase 2, mitochondrial isoform X2 [Aegilops tauschii subsp. strangulata]|nr:DAR GTPase 2, mitochondrial isoform X2 [Aegilops tauschii subsp. strangulata]
MARAAAAEAFSRRLGAAVRGLSGAWYNRHMAAADRAIRARLPLVDLVLEVRDARVPATSAFELLHRRSPEEPDVRLLVALNKADLADKSETEWVAFMKQRGCSCIAVNSHSRGSINELLNAVRGRIREIKLGVSDCTGTVLLVGIPNVGKSAIINAMHQIGRIGAAEKGKLKHATVSSHPGETRDISGYKVASHPNIYVLDTPGVLSPIFANDESGPRLVLTGAIKDSLVEEYEIAQFLLTVLNLRTECREWENLNLDGDKSSFADAIPTRSCHTKRQYSSDHTQDFIVRAVRQALSETIASFQGDLGNENDLRRLVEIQFTHLQNAFRISAETIEDRNKCVAVKLLNLYRTGRLGHYTLDHVPDFRQEVAA